MLRSLLRLLGRLWHGDRAKTTARPRRPAMQVEALEDRWVPSNIGGTVFNDLNNNGILDNGEPGIAGVTITLQHADGTLVDTTTTNANGQYLFAGDPTLPGAQATEAVDLNFASARTDSTQTGTFAQFDPSLGKLLSVQIDNNGSLTSDVRIDSLDPTATAVTGTVSGNLDLQVAGNDLQTNLNPVSSTANVAAFGGDSVTALDTSTAFSGPNAIDFGAQTATGTNTLTLTSGTNDLSAFIGTGTVTATEAATATSSASGSGNLLSQIDSASTADVHVTYTYEKLAPLAPGDYQVVETQPPGWIHGLNTADNVTPIPNSQSSQVIPVTLTDQNDSLNNNFAQLAEPSVSGEVYADANDNGALDTGESGLAGVPVTLTGVDNNGNAVNLSTQTAADGTYSFTKLQPGTYTLTEGQAYGWLPGAATAGSLGGVASTGVISQVKLSPADAGVNYDFGHVLPASVSGFVYSDLNNNGVLDPGEGGLLGVTVSLTGVDDHGQAVSLSAVTDGNGAYSFSGLRPGTYTITELQPAGWMSGKDTIGSQGGVVGVNQFSGVALGQGTNGVNNNFAELLPASVSGFVYADANANNVLDPGELGVGGVALSLTGTDALGQQVNVQVFSNADGSYAFTNLRPGSYTVTRGAAPAGFTDGGDSAGNLGGSVAPDQLGVTLGSGQAGVNYNFGLLQAPSGVPLDTSLPSAPVPLPDVSKRLLIGNLWQSW
jgi:hypothetical protein